MGRPITVDIGPLVTADADGVSLSQTAAAAQNLVINGLFAAGTFSANNVAATQSAGAAGNLTLNGAAVVAGVAQLGTPRRVYITSAADDSSISFTVYGTTYNGPCGPIGVVETVTGADTNVVATTKLFQTVSRVAVSGATAGNVTVGMSGAGTLDVARRIIITSGGNDGGITFTLTGTDVTGSPITEAVTGASGAAASSVLSYKTVTAIRTSGAAATTVQVGTNGVADSPWVRFDTFGAMAQVAGQVTVAGTVDYTVQQTLDDPNAIGSPVYDDPAGVTWVNHPDSAVVASSTTQQFNYAYTPQFAKVVLNSGTGTVVMTVAQAYQG
jgi:hypothetical protein